ncbi:MAG: AAA family ATPase [Muribaculaceae bacterium]|nr:AAA family ATPase [Muribaculaceae bacterium]
MNHKFIRGMELADKKPVLRYLYDNVWKENTTCLLHAPVEIDKSRKAMEIAVSLGNKGKKVCYVDTENRAEDHRDILSRAYNFLVYTPEYDSYDCTIDYADILLDGIEKAVSRHGVHIFVIDSITRIAAMSFGRNSSPAYIMKRLASLQARYKLSLLIVAHDSTKATGRSLLHLSYSQIDLTPEKPAKSAPSQTKTPDTVAPHPGVSTSSQSKTPDTAGTHPGVSTSSQSKTPDTAGTHPGVSTPDQTDKPSPSQTKTPDTAGTHPGVSVDYRAAELKNRQNMFYNI